MKTKKSRIPLVQQMVDDQFLRESELKNNHASNVLKAAIDLAVNWVGISFVVTALRREAIFLESKSRWSADEQI